MVPRQPLSPFASVVLFLGWNIVLCVTAIPVARFVYELPVWDRRAERQLAKETRAALLARLQESSSVPIQERDR
ncbi:hypothetical protein CCYA_CCYA11G3195 [Cyanidiococcus yangmingshanensis]|nr:hypothetical protein CCYA_CCYA11G3195 [Cyanidiococcus yangmingshanensis]